MTRPRWLVHGALAMALAAACHALAVWALPRLIMARVAAATTPEQTRGTHFPPMTDHDARRIVMPSPDLLYATCGFDLGQRALRIGADPQWPAYWSIALYASNSDNFFVLNDRQAAGRVVDLLLVGPATSAPNPPEGTLIVRSPSTRGLLLMRVLVGNYTAEKERAEAARRTLRCEPA